MEHDHLNKLSITFQQKDQCEIWWKLAKRFLKNHDFIHVNSTVAGKYIININQMMAILDFQSEQF